MRAFLATTALLGVLLSTPTLGAEGFGPVPVSYTHLTLPTNREV